MPAKKAAPKKRPMSADHKAALAKGRTEGSAIRAYLAALETHKPKRGRKRTPESIDAQLAKLNAQIIDADPLKRVDLIQRRIDLEAEKASLGTDSNLPELEAAFARNARSYSDRKGISYAAWRAAGVDSAVLKAAGIGRRS